MQVDLEEGRFLSCRARRQLALLFNDTSLGSYSNTIGAIDDLCSGHTFSPGRGIDAAKLEVSNNLLDWEKKSCTTFRLTSHGSLILPL
jgi:hypothetical protein